MQLRRILILALMAGYFATPVNAQTSAPEGSKVVVQVNLAAVQESKLGSQIIEAAKAIAADEISDGQDPDEAFQAVEQTLGFDPFEELQTVTIFVRDLEEPLEGFLGVLGMRNTTGNLEGLMLALPGYQTQEHGEHTIHSAAPDDDARVFASIHSSDTKRIVVATQAQDVKSVLDSLDRNGKSFSDRNERAQASNAIATIRLVEMPNIEDLDGPPKTIISLVKNAMISLHDSGRDLKIAVSVDTETEKQAEQLQQLAQGAAAMVALVSETEEDEELQIAADVLKTLKVERDGDSIEMSVDLPEDLVFEFLREEVDLPLE